MLMTPKKKIRYAVVGLGYIAQAAVLPAFRNARKNSQLVALVSGDEEKLKRLGDKYEVNKLIF
jgi:predicted dehydrogenase